MRLRVRVIPVLLLEGPRLVKTTKFADPVYVGDPINTVRIFNEKEVDELLLVERSASKRGAGPNFDLIEQVASEAFMPLGYGGGIRTVRDATRLLRLGIEKVSVNTAILEDPELVRHLATELGSQCVVASVDVTRNKHGGYQVYSHAGRPVPEHDPFAWIDRLVRLGAGEILLNVVDRDGTMDGYDGALLGQLRNRFDVPIIAAGGAKSAEDMTAAVRASGLSALGVGARFVFLGPYRAVLVTYLSPAEIAQIQSAYDEAGVQP